MHPAQAMKNTTFGAVCDALGNVRASGCIADKTSVIRDDPGWAVQMNGHYTASELRAILEDLEALNAADPSYVTEYQFSGPGVVGRVARIASDFRSEEHARDWGRRSGLTYCGPVTYPFSSPENQPGSQSWAERNGDNH